MAFGSDVDGHNINDASSESNKVTNPVTWLDLSTTHVNEASAKSASNFPIKVDISHPLWQRFLDSGTLSPLAFFRIFLSPPTYFHSPTPWNNRTM